MGRETFDGEGAGDAQFLAIFVRLVVKRLAGGTAGDGGVDLLLPRLSQLPEARQQVFGLGRPILPRFAGNFPFLET